MAELELARSGSKFAERVEQSPRVIEFHCLRAVGRLRRLIASINDEEMAVVRHAHAVRPADLSAFPLRQELPVSIEDLQPRVAAIADKDASARIGRDAVREVE